MKTTWSTLADTVSLLPRSGVRSPEQTAAMEAVLVHTRSLINFVCGGYKGGRMAHDIQPADFLGMDWWPRDEDFDRMLRGRVRFINQELAHLSWERVLNKDPLIVSVTLLAREVHWGMHLFVDELRTKQSTWLPMFDAHEHQVTGALPPLDRRTAGTVPHLAPARANPTPPT